MIGIDRSAGSALIRRVADALEEWNSPTIRTATLFVNRQQNARAYGRAAR
jgi:hypothetical protein